jgi:hypothetical protein
MERVPRLGDDGPRRKARRFRREEGVPEGMEACPERKAVRAFAGNDCGRLGDVPLGRGVRLHRFLEDACIRMLQAVAKVLASTNVFCGTQLHPADLDLPLRDLAVLNRAPQELQIGRRLESGPKADRKSCPASRPIGLGQRGYRARHALRHALRLQPLPGLRRRCDGLSRGRDGFSQDCPQQRRCVAGPLGVDSSRYSRRVVVGGNER